MMPVLVGAELPVLGQTYNIDNLIFQHVIHKKYTYQECSNFWLGHGPNAAIAKSLAK